MLDFLNSPILTFIATCFWWFVAGFWFGEGKKITVWSVLWIICTIFFVVTGFFRTLYHLGAFN